MTFLYFVSFSFALSPGCVFNSKTTSCSHTISVSDACNIASDVLYGSGTSLNSNILDFVKSIDNKLNLALLRGGHRSPMAPAAQLPQNADHDGDNVTIQQLLAQDSAVWNFVRDHLNFKTSHISKLKADQVGLQESYHLLESENEQSLQMVKQLDRENQEIQNEKDALNQLLLDTQQEFAFLRQTTTRLNNRAAQLSKSLQHMKLNRDTYQQKLSTSQQFATKLSGLLGQHLELSITDQPDRWEDILRILYELASQTFIGQEALTNQLAYLSTENSRLSSALKEMEELRRLHESCQTEVTTVKEEYSEMSTKLTSLEYKLADAQYDKELLQVLVVSAEDTQAPCVTSMFEPLA